MIMMMMRNYLLALHFKRQFVNIHIQQAKL